MSTWTKARCSSFAYINFNEDVYLINVILSSQTQDSPSIYRRPSTPFSTSICTLKRNKRGPCSFSFDRLKFNSANTVVYNFRFICPWKIQPFSKNDRACRVVNIYWSFGMYDKFESRLHTCMLEIYNLDGLNKILIHKVINKYCPIFLKTYLYQLTESPWTTKCKIA